MGQLRLLGEIKEGRRAPDESFREAMRRANHAAAEFRKMGIDPEWAHVEDVADDLQNDAALDSLRDRMRHDSAPESDPVDDHLD